MQLNPGMEHLYIERHKKVFPQLQAEFKRAKVSDYTIWFDADTNYLFAYIELENIEIWNNIANTEACKKWWYYMAPLMVTNPDNSPVSTELKLVYEYLE